MSFSDFPEYERLTRFLRRIVKHETYHSAYLFHGPAGVGKRRLAQAFAMAIFCPELEDDFCGQCSSCKRMQAGIFPDYHLIEPDGAFIKIEQNREIIAEATMQPYEAKKKIFVLDPADRMRNEAANSLLKVLEEPFPFSLFILITTSPRAILPTIDSRCQKVRFTPLPYDILAESLARQHNLDNQTAAALARIATGRPGLAEQLATGDFLKDRDAVIEDLAKIAQTRDIDALRIGSAKWDRKGALAFFESLIPILRDAATLQTSGDESQLLNIDRKEEIAQATRGFTAKQLLDCWKDAIECSGNLMMNANIQAQMDRVLLHLCP